MPFWFRSPALAPPRRGDYHWPGNLAGAPVAKTILVVEDEADIRELLAYNLKAEGYEVLLAGDLTPPVRSFIV